MGIAALVSSMLLICQATAGDGAASANAEIAKILEQVPGRTACAFTELREGKPTLVYGVRADERFAVGSSFKLYILGTLIRDVNDGRRLAENVARLQAQYIGPPTSELAGWPLASPVTLHTLALKMISISDNTATDHLLHILGREAIETQMAAMGHSDPAVNRPLLSTREMTALRDRAAGLPGQQYRQLDEAQRRAFLARLVAGPPDYEKLDFDAGAFDLAEWHASPLDMARALGWIETTTGDDKPAHALRAILAVDPKLPHDPKTWPFVGFKGGSEDQLLAGNWLLEHRDGRWFTLHVYCNNPAGKAEPDVFVKAISQIFALIETSLR